jgi:hypothetical protein
VADRSPIERIAAARARLAANLGALNERFTRVRKLVSPATYLDNAWVNLGLGIAIGYAAGRGPRRKRLSSGPPAVAPSRSVGDELVKAVVRAVVSGIAGALIRRALARETKRGE